ncbi:T9SS type A sorting domain-containing protein [Winogradskyella rapida]|uniref:T9SS type A sorting domain-containing protein n=1 Tax=Winogradskyella rapida TaxID=549701 RepID=A0ABW3KSN7_9FLAO
MKALKLISQLWLLLSLLFSFHSAAQNVIVGYEYAFDNNAPPVYINVPPTASFNLNTSIDVSSLPNDVNVFYIRFKDDVGQWSSIISKIFIKPPEAFATVSNIVGYEYAFDNEDPPVYVDVAATADYNLVTDIDVSNLPNDVNVFYIRFQDDVGQWSSIISKIFVKPPEAFATASNIVGYEYAFDNEDPPVYVDVAATADYNLVTDIDVSNLPNDVNVFYIRFQDDIGQWSSIISKIFVKPPEAFVTASNIVGYEYGFDDDEDPIYVSITPSVDYNLVTDIDVSSLPNDINEFYIRFQDDIGQWSSVISKIFVKPPTPITFPNNTLVSYDYWFNDDTASVISVDITPATANFNLLEIDVSQLWAGEYKLNTQFKDVYGNYSVVMTDTINKAILPKAMFSTDATEICSGSSITFTNLSVDYDNQLWNFDDGETSSTVNSAHTFSTPGAYTVSLALEDSSTGLTDVATQTITVYELPENTVTASTSLPACFGTTVTLTADYAEGNYVWSNGATTRSIDVTTSGNYSVEITNVNSSLCSVTSSSISVNFNSEIDNSVTAEASTITANLSGASYQWLDCLNGNTPIDGATDQVFAPTIDGEYAVELTVDGCTVISDCVPMSNLSVDDYDLSKTVTLHPNPVKNRLTLKTDRSITVEIYDLLGKRINSNTFRSGTHQINMSPYDNGIYLFKVKETDQPHTKGKIFRIVKN